MLQIKQLTLRQRADQRILLQDFSFNLQAGEHFAIIGEEGSGKSSLLRLIARPESPPDFLEYEGKIRLNGLRAAYLPQLLPEADKRLSVYEYLSSAPQVDAGDWVLWNESAKRLRLNPELLYSERLMGSFSGGEQVKLRFCRLLLERAELLLLDEPSNDLDLETLAWLEAFIPAQPGPLLFISHDETLLRRCANGIIHLEHLFRKTEPRWTVEPLPYEQYLEKRRRSFDKQTQVAFKEEQEYRTKREKYQRIQERVAHEQATISRADPAGGRLLKKKMKAVKSLGRRMEKSYEQRTRRPDREEAILAFFEQGKGLPEQKEVLNLELAELRTAPVKALGQEAEFGGMRAGRLLAKKLSLRVLGREKVCIIGANGCGKTTLLRELAHRLESRSDLSLGYMPQDYAERMDPQSTVLDFLLPSGTAAERQRAADYLGCMKYSAEEMRHTVAELSGGQQAKLFLLRMILQGNNVLLLDEPTRNFSPLSAPVVRELLRNFDGCVIAVSHDRLLIKELAEKVFELREDGLRLLSEAEIEVL